MSDFVWLLPLLPGLAALINGLFGKWLKTKTAAVAIFAMALTTLLSAGIFLESLGVIDENIFNKSHIKTSAEQNVAPHNGDAQGNIEKQDDNAKNHHTSLSKEVIIYKWITSDSLNINIGFLVDNLSVVMILFISFVSTLVFIYSTGYMKRHGSPEAGYARYFCFMSIFTMSMYILVLANNFALMFVGWEGVGLCSYLLIGFYMDKHYAADAGKKAFIVNRVGDFGLLIGMFLIFWKIGSLDMTTVFSAATHSFSYGDHLITAITLLLFLGACGKSAQFPLYVWLPDAMAGPTPVSALIHAATMVTAGVYLIARCNVLYSIAPFSSEVVAIVGALTALLAAFIGITQRDIKKVLAYSTISQFGYMFLAVGVGAFASGVFHITSHAFFKACLFLCAGSVIHALDGEQDMFKMGGLSKKLPLTTWTYVIAALSITGIPIFSGFFSKDEILWDAFRTGHFHLWLIGEIAALMTAFYIFRSVFLTFFGKSRLSSAAMEKVHESPSSMTVPLIILAFFAIFEGFINIPEAFVGNQTIAHKFHHYLTPIFIQGEYAAFSFGQNAYERVYPHYAEILLAGFSVLVGLIGIFLAHNIYIAGGIQKASENAKNMRSLYLFSYNKIWWDDFCKWFFAKGTLLMAYLAGVFDKIAVDGVVNGIGGFIRWLGLKARRAQSGNAQDYALWIVIGIVVLIFLCFVSAFELENIIKK